MTTTMKCCIEEYENEQGRLSARLRQKGTGKKVDLGFVDAEALQHFVRFLSAAKQNQTLIPGAFSKDSEEDSVVVSGNLDFDAPDEVRFLPNERLQYLFG